MMTKPPSANKAECPRLSIAGYSTRGVYRSLTVPQTRRQAIGQREVWPFRVVRKAAVWTSASPSVAHASHEGLNDRNGSRRVGGRRNGGSVRQRL